MEFMGLYSEGELALARSGVADNFRIDGRSCFDLRKTITRIGVIPSCNGSAQVQSTNCNITVGIKIEVGQPLENEPDCGIVEINADCSANASPKFEGRGGEEIAQEIVFVITNSIIPSIDRRQLCISAGYKVWIIYIEVLILECSCVAQLLDLSSIGVKAALFDTRIPRVIADEEDENDFMIANECEEYCPLDAQNLPLLLTLTRINDVYVADVLEEEAAAGIARITFAFDSHGELFYLKKSGPGSCNPQPLKQLLEKARNLALQMHQDLDQQIKI